MKNYKVNKNGSITIKIDPNINVGVGHIDYSGYGAHSNFKSNKKIRKSNRNESRDIKRGNYEN